jgi:hypothetical protein
MAAGLGFIEFSTGDVLSAAAANGYLASQTVMVFANSAARASAITSPQEGMFSFLKDTNATQFYDGAAWTNLDTTGMVNPMTTTGDTIYSSSGTTPARLGIGSTGQVLTVAAGLPSWATPAGGGGMTSIASGSLSSSSLNLTSIVGTYKDLKLVVRNVSIATNGDVRFTINGRGSDYSIYWAEFTGGTVTNASTAAQANYGLNYNTIKSATSMSVEINFPDYANTTTRKQFNTQMSYDNAASAKSGATTYGYYSGTGLNDAITTINFSASATFSTGTYILYGVN